VRVCMRRGHLREVPIGLMALSERNGETPMDHLQQTHLDDSAIELQKRIVRRNRLRDQRGLRGVDKFLVVEIFVFVLSVGGVCFWFIDRWAKMS